MNTNFFLLPVLSATWTFAAEGSNTGSILLAIGFGLAIVALIVLMFKKQSQSASMLQESVTPELARQSSAMLNENVHREIYSLLAQGQKIQAIKRLREATGAGLFDATARIEALERFPQEHRGPSQEF